MPLPRRQKQVAAQKSAKGAANRPEPPLTPLRLLRNCLIVGAIAAVLLLILGFAAAIGILHYENGDLIDRSDAGSLVFVIVGVFGACVPLIFYEFDGTDESMGLRPLVPTLLGGTAIFALVNTAATALLGAPQIFLHPDLIANHWGLDPRQLLLGFMTAWAPSLLVLAGIVTMFEGPLPPPILRVMIGLPMMVAPLIVLVVLAIHLMHTTTADYPAVIMMTGAYTLIALTIFLIVVPLQIRARNRAEAR